MVLWNDTIQMLDTAFSARILYPGKTKLFKIKSKKGCPTKNFKAERLTQVSCSLSEHSLHSRRYTNVQPPSHDAAMASSVPSADIATACPKSSEELVCFKSSPNCLHFKSSSSK
mmetsp:Transcript_10867/g.16076  ORF Transcript_10867/g.16076 Transcript_10867/m.16076 type:complete len:114 (-) Transcript_10867:589-930(-)